MMGGDVPGDFRLTDECVRAPKPDLGHCTHVRDIAEATRVHGPYATTDAVPMVRSTTREVLCCWCGGKARL
jgi:hypothetical protein